LAAGERVEDGEGKTRSLRFSSSVLPCSDEASCWSSSFGLPDIERWKTNTDFCLDKAEFLKFKISPTARRQQLD
jgi:hypothetical protein